MTEVRRRSLVGFTCLLLLFGCKPPQSESFQVWFQNQDFTYLPKSEGKTNSQFVNFVSVPLKLDTIYRSMQGPMSAKEVALDVNDDDFVWMRGYSVRIRESKTGATLSDGFMCHNNLNIDQKALSPWKIRTRGTATRLVTITEGQTSIKFPDGFGIPIPSGQSLNIISQVLNHNDTAINLDVVHDVQIEYVKQSGLHAPLTPLFQQAVFILKHESGPIGEYGMAPLCAKHLSNASGTLNEDPGHKCEITYDQDNYNPYSDQYGRTFTSHWAIPIGKQVLTTNVTHIMNLAFDTKIHYIGVHVHPFAKTLELRDATLDTSLFTANVRAASGRIGIEHIDHYSDAEGIAVYKDHTYELISTYECTDSINAHTAMATMFLYMHDKK